jgi:hypothetical protein
MRSRFVPTLPGLAVLLGVASLALAVHPARAQPQHPGHLPPGYCPPPPGHLPTPPQPAAPSPQPQQQAQPGQQQPQQQQPQEEAPTDTGAQPGDAGGLAPEASAAVGGEAAAFAAPNVIGDQLGSTLVRVPFRMIGSATPTAVILPIQARGAFKIAENESPQPRDRIFFNYNYFNNVCESVNPPGVPRIDVHRETFGFEKTFYAGMASIGLRVPVLQVDGDGSLSSDDFGDLSVVLKYALINNCCTGNVLSTGLVVTAPTGGDSSFSFLGVDDIHTTILQPFAGFIYNCGDWYVQGFTSVAIPMDDRDVTYYFNDVAIGYWLYVAPDCRFRTSNAFAEKGPGGCWCDPTMNAFSNGGCAPYCCGHHFISAIIPTVEAHVTTPLDHRNENLTDLILAHDIVIVTAGVHIQLLDHANVLVGTSVPVTGPKPFDIEGVVQVNWRF